MQTKIYHRFAINVRGQIDELIGAFTESTGAAVEQIDDAAGTMARLEECLDLETNTDTLDALRDEYVRVSREYVDALTLFQAEYSQFRDAVETIRLDLDDLEDRLEIPAGFSN
jgi:phage shock protein A